MITMVSTCEWFPTHLRIFLGLGLGGEAVEDFDNPPTPGIIYIVALNLVWYPFTIPSEGYVPA